MAIPPGCPPASALPRHRAVAYGGGYVVIEVTAIPGCSGAPGLPNPACPVDPNKPGGARNTPCATKPKES